MDRHGNAPASGERRMTVLRSGRRNMQMTDMATLSLLSNPLDGFSGNVFQNILAAQAMEFSGTWRSECDCISSLVPLNCFVANRCGVWRLSSGWSSGVSRSA